MIALNNHDEQLDAGHATKLAISVEIVGIIPVAHHRDKIFGVMPKFIIKDRSI